MLTRLALMLLVLSLAGCGGTRPAAAPGPAAASTPASPPLPPVELGHRPPNKPMTSANMPFFDVVTYCEITTRKDDTRPRGPLYDNCATNQLHYRSIIGQAIDARHYKDAKVVQCAESSHTAYEGMWYCMNDQPFS